MVEEELRFQMLDLRVRAFANVIGGGGGDSGCGIRGSRSKVQFRRVWVQTRRPRRKFPWRSNSNRGVLQSVDVERMESSECRRGARVR